MSILDRIFKGKKQSRVGIDISSTTVKLLELSESNGGFRVEAYSVASLPHGAVYEKNANNIGEVATAIQSVMHQVGRERLKSLRPSLAPLLSIK